MVMSWVWTTLLSAAILSAVINKQGQALGAAVLQGAQSGLELAIGIGGSLCLWSGAGKLMEACGLSARLGKLLKPLLIVLFPSVKGDPVLAGDLSANICANILGLGNAATPAGIRATGRMVKQPGIATDEMCRLIVLNTASIQLIPGNVAAIRAGLGSSAPFDILPAVWVTSVCSASLGVAAAWVLGKVWKHD